MTSCDVQVVEWTVQSMAAKATWNRKLIEDRTARILSPSHENLSLRLCISSLAFFGHLNKVGHMMSYFTINCA